MNNAPNLPVPGRGIALRLRWGITAAIVLSLFLLVSFILIFDDFDSSVIGGSSGLVATILAHTQLRPSSKSSSSIPSHHHPHTESFTESFISSLSYSSYPENTISIEKTPSNAPLGMLLAKKFGLVDTFNDSQSSSSHSNQLTSSSPSFHALSDLPLHSLNASSQTELFRMPGLSSTNEQLGLLVVHTHIANPNGTLYAHIQIMSRAISPLLVPSSSVWQASTSSVISEPWLLRYEKKFDTPISSWIFDKDTRRIAVALAPNNETPSRIVTSEFSSDYSTTTSTVTTITPSSSSSISTVSLLSSDVCWSYGNSFDTHLFTCSSLHNSSLINHCIFPADETNSAHTKYVVSLRTLSPSDSGNERILVTEFQTNRDWQKYVARVFERLEPHKDGKECRWSYVYTLSGKPFGTAKTRVFKPQPVPSSNLVIASPMGSTRMLGICLTPFVLTFDTSSSSSSHQSIKIINLAENLQFTQMAFNTAGNIMALADNLESIVFLKRAPSEESALQWKVILELALPKDLFHGLPVMSIALVHRSEWNSVPDTLFHIDTKTSSHDPVILLALLETGVIISFDLSQQSSQDDFSLILDWHLELLLCAFSVLAYFLLTRLTRPTANLRAQDQEPRGEPIHIP